MLHAQSVSDCTGGLRTTRAGTATARVPVSGWPAVVHGAHIRTLAPATGRYGAHAWHTSIPHRRQWCRRTSSPNSTRHCPQHGLPSGCHCALFLVSIKRPMPDTRGLLVWYAA